MVLVAVVALGLALGSFANVPIYRWAHGATIGSPARSTCPDCGATIRARDNIPIVSWLLLRRRCRGCATPIHWRYPLVEGVTAILFASAAAAIGVTWLLPSILALAWSLVVVTAIDLEHRIIPNKLTYRLPFVLVVLLAPPTVWGPGSVDDLLRGMLAAVLLPAGMLALSEGYRLVRGRSGFGMGDVKLLVSLGLVCGYLGWFNVIVLLYGSVITAVVVAFGLILAGRAKLASRIPFGPYLAAGTILAILADEPLRTGVSRLLGV